MDPNNPKASEHQPGDPSSPFEIAGYPAQGSPYPPQGFAYPVQGAPVPNRAQGAPHPQMQGGPQITTWQQPGYPLQQTGYPVQQPGYPGEQPGHPSQPAAYSSEQSKNSLNSGDVLKNDLKLMSPNGEFSLCMQKDGNLVIYSGSSPKWSSMTNGKGCQPFRLVMQKDNNLCIYDGSGQCTWASNTCNRGNAGAWVTMQVRSQF